MLLGEYPEGYDENWADVMPIEDGDLATIRQPLDFYGFNYYNPMRISAAKEGAEVPFVMEDIPGYPKTGFGWPIVPEGMHQVIGQLVERYPDIPPIYITENGCAYPMGPDENGVVDDQPRIDYLDSPPARRGRRDRRRRRRTRLLLVVADGQLRVGRRLHPALRAGAHRLRDPGAYAEALLRLVLRGDRGQPRMSHQLDRALAEPTGAVSRVWVLWLALISIGVWSGFFGPIQVLLAQQAEAIDPAHKETSLALVLFGGALVSTVLNPVWGAFSDRTVLRIGRRLPWVLGGLVGGVVAMLVLSQAQSILVMALGWALAQAALNAMLAAITATVPDQVPSRQRGAVGGWLAIAQTVGVVAGSGDRGRDRQHRGGLPRDRRACWSCCRCRTAWTAATSRSPRRTVSRSTSAASSGRSGSRRASTPTSRGRGSPGS